MRFDETRFDHCDEICDEICDELSKFDFDLDFDISNLVNQISSSGNNWMLVCAFVRFVGVVWDKYLLGNNGITEKNMGFHLYIFNFLFFSFLSIPYLFLFSQVGDDQRAWNMALDVVGKVASE